ncbi:MAG: hypothetical protein GVY13_03635 [Alphaproteobacteria bacterium]|jgi:Uma2 family endonuclease|nr:hypothetical protein [Alphaproteobacteria bacterium]
MADAALKPMTAEEFFAWCPNDDRRWELHDGRPVAMAPPSRAHRIIAFNLSKVLADALSTRPACLIEQGGGVMPTDRTDTYYEADVTVSCSPHEPGQLYTPEPVLVMEILSPSTEREDRRTKLPDYRRMPSVMEVVLIDQTRPRVEVHRRTGNDAWSVDLFEGMTARLFLRAVALETDLATVYAHVAFPSRSEPEVS